MRWPWYVWAMLVLSGLWPIALIVFFVMAGLKRDPEPDPAKPRRTVIVL